MDRGFIFTTLYFLHKLRKYTTYLERCIKLAWRGLPGINAHAYWTYWSVTKKIKSCKYGPRCCNILFVNFERAQ